MAKNVADLLLEVLAEAGVQGIRGVSADSLNGITDCIRTRKDIQWIRACHEESAAFAAEAEAHLTRRVAVCTGSCGPVKSHLIHCLYDSHRIHVPLESASARQAVGARVSVVRLNAGEEQVAH